MSSSDDTGDQPPDSDEFLLGCLEEATAELRAGGHPDPRALVGERPELESELRALLGALVVTEQLARSGTTLSENNSASETSLEGREESNDPIANLDGLDDYEILEELGRGGMGIVYKARQRSLDRTVALKILRLGGAASTVDVARFRSEAQAAARLDHPNIVPVYEVGETRGQLYFTMRFVAGETLAARLARGPLESREAAELVSSVANAIQYAHEQGIYHRDLKPSNILIDPDGIPHVTDFGLAKEIEGDGDLTETGAVLGTPSYMSPEQATGASDRIDATTDVYGLGSVLYHALTGRPPFQAATPVTTILAVIEQDPPPPRVLQPSIDRDLELVVLKCLQKPQDLRYESARELAHDLRAYRDGDSVSARSTSIVDVVSRIFRETHHAQILENWGLLWMLHSVALIALCVTTNAMKNGGVEARIPYIALWSGGLGTWGVIFWGLRHRSGPITFMERQIAHLWAGAILSSSLLFLVEILLDLPVLSLSPVLPLLSGNVFLSKGGILSGRFYFEAVALYLCSAVIILYPGWGLTVFGVVSAACFFFPGLKYFRRHRDRIAAAGRET